METAPAPVLAPLAVSLLAVTLHYDIATRQEGLAKFLSNLRVLFCDIKDF